MKTGNDQRQRPFLRPWGKLALLYLLLLVLSNGVRLLNPVDGVVEPGQLTTRLPLVDEGRLLTTGASAARPVRLAYRELGVSDGPPVLLIHGTPVAGTAVLPLAEQLAVAHRVIVPDLPGFGGSSRRLPDYSFVAHAVYLRALLDRLGIESAHLVAYSQGGGVALALAEQAPQRVRSLAMVAAIGVQELELLGQYRLNHLLYAAQQALIHGLQWLTPHFGYFDRSVLNTAYGRNLLDSDQRPLRAALRGLQAPTLVLHGRDDGFVPFDAAREHTRLVPQSEFLALDGGHLLPIFQPALVAAPIADFLERVESGSAINRLGADAARSADAERPFDWRDVAAFDGLRLAVVLLLLALATYISEDLACITAGLMVAQGTIGFPAAVGACMAGIFSGDMLLFLSGRLIGPALIEGRRLRWLVDESRLARARQWFLRRGGVVIFVSRFVPGTRLPSYLVAGALRMPILHFALFFLAAAVIWTPLLVGIAYLTGANAMALIEDYQRYGPWLLLIVALTLWLLLRLVVSLLANPALRARLRGGRGLRAVPEATSGSAKRPRPDRSVGAAETVCPEPAPVGADAGQRAALREEIERAKIAVCARYGIDPTQVRVAQMGGRNGGLGNAIPIPVPFRRRYLVRYHRCMRDADPLAIRGLCAHELMHVLQYSRASYGELLVFIARYAVLLLLAGSRRTPGRDWLRGIEHLTDLMAVEYGEGAAIAAWKRYKDRAMEEGVIVDNWRALYISAADVDALGKDSDRRRSRIGDALEALGASDPLRPFRGTGT